MILRVARTLCLGLGLVALTSLACGGGGGGQAAPPASRAPSALVGGAKVGQVTVRAGDALGADKAERLNAVDGPRQIEGRVVQELISRGVYAPEGELALDITVTGYRMRSAATTVWVGSMAGGDSIAVNVDVTRNGNGVKTYGASSGSIRGGIVGAGQRGRFDHLNNTLARRIADQL